MGNVLAIHGNSDTHWGRENENRIFETFLNKTLQNHHKKRACCLGIVGVNASTATDGYGVQVPIANVGIKNSNDLTTGRQEIDTRINEVLNNKNNKDILKKEGVTVKRVSFYNENKADYCCIDDKQYIPPNDNMDDATPTNVCDDYYRDFCKEHVTTCTNEDKMTDTAPRCSYKTSVGDVLFPNANFPDRENAAHVYPEDCVCMNSVVGRNYNTDYNIFVKSVDYINPVHADKKCNELSGFKKKAYPTTRDRKMAAKGMTICENNINIHNVTNLELYEIEQNNNCISADEAAKLTEDIDKSNKPKPNNPKSPNNTSLFIGIGALISIILVFVIIMLLI